MKKILFLFFSVLFLTLPSVAQETFFQNGLSHDILEVKFSPDMTKLVSYSYDDGVFLWSVKDGRLLWHRDTDFVQKANEYYTLTSFAFSPDQKLLASGSGNGTLQLWDAATGKILWRADVYEENVTAIEFTPDGKNIVSAASPKKGEDEIKIVRVADGQTILKLDGNPCTVVAMAFENDGRILKTGNLDGNILTWNLESGKQVNTDANVRCGISRTYEWETSFSPDLKISAKRTGEKELTLQNTQTGEIIKKIEANAYRLYSKFSANAKNLIFSGYDGFTLYDLATNETRKIDEFSRNGSTFDLSRDGSLFAEGGSWGDAAIKITETATGKSFFLDGHPGVVGGIAFTPDGNYFAVGGSDKVVYIFDAETRIPVKKLVGHNKPINSLAFSPNGKILLSSGDNEVMKVWDWREGRFLQDVKSEADIFGVDTISFSSDGKYFLTTSDRDEFRLWDAKTYRLVRNFKTSEAFESSGGGMTIGYNAVPPRAANFSANGQKIIAAYRDDSIRIWNAADGRQLKKLKTCKDISFAVFINADKNILAYCKKDDEEQIKIFDAASGREIFKFDDEETGFIHTIALSPNGKNFATTDISGDVYLWEFGKSEPLREFEIGFSGDDALAFSPDGEKFVVGGRNRNLLMFDAETGEKLWQLIPFYEPDALETEFLKQKKVAQSEVTKRKAVREKQAEAEVPSFAKKITAKFSHYGTAESFWDEKIAESGAPDKSKLKLPKEKASVAWFVLVNESDLPILIDTNSMMFDPKCKGLCDGAEVSSRYVMELKNGNTRVNGIDMYAKTLLPPKMSVYFSVSLKDFAASKAIYLTFTFQKENPDDEMSDDYGAEQKLFLCESDLPKN